jgi:type I restriction enzyme S subunit
LRKVAVADFEGVCANTTFVVETKDPSRLLQAFLPFVMSGEPFHAFAIAESKGSVNPYVNWSDIERYEFDLPPLDEQKRIADLLWAIERHIRSLKTSLAEHTLARSRWFGDALVQGATSNGWRLEHIPALVTSGPTNGKSARANDEQRGVPTLSISAIRDGRVLGGSSVKYMDVELSDVANYVIREDDFLIVRGNGNKQLTGRGGVAAGGLPVGCVYPDLLIRLRFDPKVIITAFAAEQWNSAHAHNELIQRAKSTNGIWKINGQDIRSHRLVVPPLAEQNELLERLKIFGAAAEAIREESVATHALRQSALAEAFGGN